MNNAKSSDEMLKEMSSMYKQSNGSKTISLHGKILEQLCLDGNLSNIRNFIPKIGKTYWEKGDCQTASIIFLLSFLLAKAYKDNIGMVESLINLISLKIGKKEKKKEITKYIREAKDIVDQIISDTEIDCDSTRDFYSINKYLNKLSELNNLLRTS